MPTIIHIGFNRHNFWFSYSYIPALRWKHRNLISYLSYYWKLFHVSESPNNAEHLDQCLHSGFYWSKDDGGDNWSYKVRKTPVKSSPQTNQTNIQLLAGQMPLISTSSVIEGKKYHIPPTCSLLAHLAGGGSSSLVFHQWRLLVTFEDGCQVSDLWCQYPIPKAGSEPTSITMGRLSTICWKKRNMYGNCKITLEQL